MPKKLTNKAFKEKLKEYTSDTVELISDYINRRTKVKVRCKQCGFEWELNPSNLYTGHSFKGCEKCLHNELYTECQCDYCGKTFEKLKSLLHDTNFCSKECGNRYKNAQKLKTEDGTNYRRNAFLKYPHKCAICGYDKDERILEVHHIDEDRSHNELENLMILCPNCHKKLTLHLYDLDELMSK